MMIESEEDLRIRSLRVTNLTNNARFASVDDNSMFRRKRIGSQFSSSTLWVQTILENGNIQHHRLTPATRSLNINIIMEDHCISPSPKTSPESNYLRVRTASHPQRIFNLIQRSHFPIDPPTDGWVDRYGHRNV